MVNGEEGRAQPRTAIMGCRQKNPAPAAKARVTPHATRDTGPLASPARRFQYLMHAKTQWPRRRMQTHTHPRVGGSAAAEGGPSRGASLYPPPTVHATPLAQPVPPLPPPFPPALPLRSCLATCFRHLLPPPASATCSRHPRRTAAEQAASDPPTARHVVTGLAIPPPVGMCHGARGAPPLRSRHR